MKKHSKPFSTLVLLLASAMPVMAADLDPVIYADDANLIKPAELGSGWYLRGDLGFNFNGRHEVLATGTTNADVFEDNNFTDGFNYSVGVGYKMNSLLRFDVNVGRLTGSDYKRSQQLYEPSSAPPGTPADLIVDLDPSLDGTATFDTIPCNGTGLYVNPSNGVTYMGPYFIQNCITSDAVEYDTTFAMANAYVDLPGMGRFQPYVGGGIGFGRTSWRQETNQVDCTPVAADVHVEACQSYTSLDQPTANQPYTQPGVISDGVDYRFGYNVTAGLGYQLTDNITIDAAYKYMNFGKGDLEAGSGSALAAEGYGTHQVNLGVRIATW